MKSCIFLMKTRLYRMFWFFLMAGFIPLLIASLFGCQENPEVKSPGQDRTQAHVVSSKSVLIIWSVSDKDAAVQTVLAYPLNARINGWLENVNLIISGPSVKLVAEDPEIRKIIEQIAEAGITVIIDKASTDYYKLENELKSLKCEIIYPGKLLTRFIDADATILTF